MTDTDHGNQGTGVWESLRSHPLAHVVSYLWDIVYAAGFLALIGYLGSFEIAVYFGFGLLIANLGNGRRGRR